MMQNIYDYKKFGVLFVDDEELTLKYFERNFKSVFTVLTASSAESALEILEDPELEVAVILSDQRMPGMTGTEFLERVRKSHPSCIRMLITAYSDMDATVAAINNGAVYKYITKPYEDLELEVTVKRAIEFYTIQKERNALLGEKMGALHRSILTERVLSMGVLSAGISHHMRNSLTAVQAFLDMAPSILESDSSSSEVNNPDFWNGLYEVAQGQVKEIVNMLSEVECYTTVQNTNFQDKVPVCELIQQEIKASEDRLKQAGIHLNASRLDDKIQVTGDERLLEQAFRLLFQDAELFLPASQGLYLESHVADKDGKSTVSVTIKGFCSETELDHILPLFNPFNINKEKPSEPGVNLLGAFFLIYHHGGMLDFSKRGTSDSQIEIVLPADANEPLYAASEQEFMRKVFRLERQWEDHLLSL